MVFSQLEWGWQNLTRPRSRDALWCVRAHPPPFSNNEIDLHSHYLIISLPCSIHWHILLTFCWLLLLFPSLTANKVTWVTYAM
jgi:hypothetical protein